MSAEDQQQGALDPRLGSGLPSNPTQYGERASNQPYYHYPTPTTHTPQQSGATASSGNNHSTQASPDQQGANSGPVDDDESPDHAGADGQNGDDAKRPRSCEACRGLKVRCDQDPSQPDQPCRRCAKAGRQCIVTQPSRKRQKKADSRVAELEKKLDALTAALHQQNYTAPPPQKFVSPATQSPSSTMHGRPSAGSLSQLQYQGSHSLGGSPSLAQTSSTDTSTPPNKRRRTEGETEDAPPTTKETGSSFDDRFKEIHRAWVPSTDTKKYLASGSPEEFVARINKLISPSQASTIFNAYVKDLCPHMPGVVLPEGTTPEQVLKEKPILYVCILSAASFGTLPQEVFQDIGREAIGAIADCVVRNGAKSLELIQAMQVVGLWYRPPEKAEQTNFYQIIHMAAVMALDIGLGKRFNPAKSRRGFGGPNAQYAPGPHKTIPQDSDTIEARRAWLTCYYLCASASMVLRRPNLIRWTNYMKECIEVLESHPDAAPSDKLFCQHIKIQRICEDIGLTFLMDDSTANVSITDPKVSYALNVLENKLKEWKENIPPECRNRDLEFFEHVTSLYLHEIALHFNHNVDDFRVPFTEESLKSVANTSDTLTQNQMAALEACVKSSHGIMDTILSYDTRDFMSLPMLLFFIRCIYALVILIKMHVAVCTPKSELGKMIQPDDLRVDHYLDQFISLLKRLSAANEEFRPHPKMLFISNILKDWFQRHKEGVEAQKRGESPGKQQSSQPNKQQENPQTHQTPLHLLSQVAIGDQKQASDSQSDWTFDSPGLIDYTKDATQRHMGIGASGNQQSTTQAGNFGQNQMSFDPQGNAAVDPFNQDYGWGSGFEQAMDMALGSMDGLQGNGLDTWFLGDSMAPFAFNGDMPAAPW